MPIFLGGSRGLFVSFSWATEPVAYMDNHRVSEIVTHDQCDPDLPGLLFGQYIFPVED